MNFSSVPLLCAALLLPAVAASPLTGHPENTWVKQSPLPSAPESPRMGYEGACVWDNKNQLLIRYGGHNQGGGGEQGSEIWTYEPHTRKWALKETNISPPGVCCGAQNVFDPKRGRYIRFSAFSGNHGWQWAREIYLNDSTVWTYDAAENRWRNMRPLPAPRMVPLRAASWDTHQDAALVFGGEGGARETVMYDPHRNEWRWLKPPVQPEPRSGGQMAYDFEQRKHVFFGSQFNDEKSTWIFDAVRNEWRDAKPAELPPTAQNDPVLAYDPGSKRVLAIVKLTEGKDEAAQHTLQTWSYEVGKNRWERQRPATEPDASGSRARQLLFAPELGLALLENCPSKPREQQIWSYRFPGSKPAPTPWAAASRMEARVVEEGHASVLAADRVELEWNAVPGAVAYHIERAVVEVFTEDQLLRLKRQTPVLAEPSVSAFRRIGAFQRITAKPTKTTTFTDDTIDLRAPATATGEPVFERKVSLEQLDPQGRGYRFAVYAYRVRSVNDAGTESGPSMPFFTIPSAPENVFSRERGTACELKWTRNREKSLRGYRVYRLDGRYDKDTVSRLTATPADALQWTDESAGKSTRRYYVVAVDALGQEGFPSAPVWFEREWKAYYRPFTGEWHQ
jgi:hypothetical protein